MIPWVLAIICILLAASYVFIALQFFRLKRDVENKTMLYEIHIKELERKLSIYETGRRYS